MNIPPHSPLAVGWRRELLAIVLAVGVSDALDAISAYAELAAAADEPTRRFARPALAQMAEASEVPSRRWHGRRARHRKR